MTWRVRVANAGLKVDVFSSGCRGLVRVAGKGLSEGKLTLRLRSGQALRLRSGQAVDSLKLKKRTSGELNAEAPGAQREEKPGERRRDWEDCDEIMGQSTTDLRYCQGLLFSGIIRMKRWKPRVYKELAGVNWFDNGMEK